MIYRLNTGFLVSNWSTCSQPVWSSWIDWSDSDYKRNVVYLLMLYLTALLVARVIRHSTSQLIMMMVMMDDDDLKGMW